MVATTLPAVVRVVDLPLGTTVTGAELFEAVQTSGGVGQSVQLSLGQMITSIIGGLPTGGATGTILNKSSGSNFSTQFSAINTFVNVGTALATTGSATSIVAFVPNQGITSTQIANNAVGTNQIASSLGIASSLSIGTILTVSGTAIFNGTAIYNATTVFGNGIQVTGTSQFTGSFNVAGTTLVTGTFGQVGTSLMTGLFGVVGTSNFTGTHGVVGTTLFTSGAFGVVGTSLFTSGNFGVVGTSNFTGAHFVVGTALFTSGAFGVVGTGIFTGTLNIVGTSAIGTSTGNALFLSPTAAGTSGNLTVGFPNTGAPGSSGSTDTAVAVRFSVQNVAYDIGIYASGNVWHQARLGGNLATNFPIVLSPNGGGVAVGTAGLTGNAVLGVQGTALFTSGNFGVVGTSLFTSGAFGVVGTSNFTGTFVLGSLGAGLLAVSATGVVTATTVAAGSFVLLNTLSPNNVASTNDTSSFSATYKSYLITFENVCPATQTTTFQLTVATSGSNFISSGYVSQTLFTNNGTTLVQTNTSFIQLSGAMQTTLGLGMSGSVRLFNPASTTARKQFVGETSSATPGAISTSTITLGMPSGWYDGALNAVTGVNFAFSSGNIQTGTIKIYGLS